MSPRITSSSSVEPFTPTKLDSVGVSLESFTYVEDSTFSSSTPLSRFSGDQIPMRTGAQDFNHGSSSADSTASTKDVRLGLLTGNHGSSADETSFFLPSPRTDAGAASSISLGTPDGRVRPQSRPGPPRCQCFARVLQFMAQLSTDPSQAWSVARDGGGPGPVVSCFPWNDTTNDRDEDDVEGDSDEEDQHRVFVQHILSRLAGLRALIIRLSKRLTEPKSESFPGASRWPTLPQVPSYYSVVEGRIEIMPFSASSLGALSSDLHNRLSGMSQAISGKLQELQEEWNEKNGW
ncbi:hypothetical protein QIS74_07398 [Colletotrichum tabaci]|uniref:Uncharacterized protein n=1 Tax=Colletotrichum tabaci TaxID=1209068 RepID=A0AAV9TBR9_9PEZI